MAEEQKINIKFFNIIYEALEHVEKSLSGLLEPDIKETVLGSAADTTAFWTKSSVKEQVAVEAQYDRSPIIGEENKVVGHNNVLLSPAKEAREAHEVQGLRYTELIAPIIKAGVVLSQPPIKTTPSMG